MAGMGVPLAPESVFHFPRNRCSTWPGARIYAREQRSGGLAKEAADGLARRVIDWSGAPRPTSLRHDAAEAVLLGLWAVLEVGWLAQVPPEVRR